MSEPSEMTLRLVDALERLAAAHEHQATCFERIALTLEHGVPVRLVGAGIDRLVHSFEAQAQAVVEIREDGLLVLRNDEE